MKVFVDSKDLFGSLVAGGRVSIIGVDWQEAISLTAGNEVDIKMPCGKVVCTQVKDTLQTAVFKSWSGNRSPTIPEKGKPHLIIEFGENGSDDQFFLVEPVQLKALHVFPNLDPFEGHLSAGTIAARALSAQGLNGILPKVTHIVTTAGFIGDVEDMGCFNGLSVEEFPLEEIPRHPSDGFYVVAMGPRSEEYYLIVEPAF